MPSRVSWMLTAKLIHLQLLDFVTHDEIIAHMYEIEQLVKENSHSTIHLIVDFSAMSYLPMDMRFLSQVSRPLAALPNTGHVIILGSKLPLFTTIATLVSQIVHFKYKTAKSFEEALNYLQAIDPELEVAI
jgi:hypothetical protein